MIERNSSTMIALGAGTDRVIASMPIPPGGVFMGYRAEVHVIGQARQDVLIGNKIAFKAVIVNLSGAMDTVASVDTIFDQMVPKDIILDIDAGDDDIDWDDGTIGQPFAEPGEPNWNELTQLGETPFGLTDIRRTITYASGGAKHQIFDVTNFYIPTLVVKVGSKRQVKVRGASYFLLAAGTPVMDAVTTSVPNTIVDDRWSLLTYPDVAFDMMLPDLLGLSEAGAESPYADVAGVIADIVEPTLHEQTTGSWASAAYTIFADWKCRIATPGRPQMRTLKGNE